MDLTRLPAPNDRKAALKAALQAVGAKLSEQDRLNFYTGAMYGVGELESGELTPPGNDEIKILGQKFLDGRNFVVSFPLA